MYAVDATADYPAYDSTEHPLPPPESPPQAPASKRALPSRKAIVLIVMLAIACTVFGVVLGLLSKQRQDALLIALDPFGITAPSKAEHGRVYRIKLMTTITSEQKDVLISRTVFIGCTREMALLALGSPKEALRGGTSQWGGTETWVYIFPQDKRPTMLEFRGDTLVAAYKGSAVETVRVRH